MGKTSVGEEYQRYGKKKVFISLLSALFDIASLRR
jgi:hypothetical protein